MSNNKKINSELSLISRYIGLKYSKYILLVLLIIVYYPMRATPLYIFLASFFTPLILGLSRNTHQDMRDGTEDFILVYTARKRSFSTQKYKNEYFGFIVTLFLLCIWQININYHDAYEMPLRAVPSMLIVIYIITRILIGTFIKYKTKYDFMNLNI